MESRGRAYLFSRRPVGWLSKKDMGRCMTLASRFLCSFLLALKLPNTSSRDLMIWGGEPTCWYMSARDSVMATASAACHGYCQWALTVLERPWLTQASLTFSVESKCAEH